MLYHSNVQIRVSNYTGGSISYPPTVIIEMILTQGII